MAGEILQFIHQWYAHGGICRGLQVGQEAKTSNRSESTPTFAVLEPETGSCTISNQTQPVVLRTTSDIDLHYMISIMEHGWISVTTCSRQVHWQSQHKRGLKCPNQSWQTSWCRFSSLITAATLPLSSMWFFLFIRWRTEGRRLLSKPRNAQARHQSQSQQAKEFSRWLQCDMKKSSPLISPQEKTSPHSKIHISTGKNPSENNTQKKTCASTRKKPLLVPH